jgi:hypothetical protein
MKKIVLSLATLAALSTASLAASSFDKLKAWNELERPENKTTYGQTVTPGGSFGGDEAAFAVPAGGGIATGSAYEKHMRFTAQENPEHY